MGKCRKNQVNFFSVFCAILLSTFGMGLLYTSHAAEWAPSRAITMIVPFGAGGSMDVQGRYAAPFLEKCLNQKIIVVNKPGGGGMVAFQALGGAEPDGLTVEHISISHSIDFALNTTLPTKWDNMTSLGSTQATPSVIAVPEDSKYKTLEDFLKDVRQNPGKVRVAVGTLNTVDTQITAALLKSARLSPKDSVVLVPFKSSGEAGVATLGNKVECTTSTIYAILGLLQAGKLRALAITGGKERLKAFPQVPTFTELGYPEASIYAWRGYLAPPGTPKNIVDKWYGCIKEMKNNPEWRDYWEKQGDVILEMNPEEFKKFMGNEIEKFRQVGEELGLITK
jgi:tripartite-type tricarboxylate transporter receptor subunit TctC